MKKSIFIILTTVMLLGCASSPEQFKAGEPTSAPRGCQEMRERGGKC